MKVTAKIGFLVSADHASEFGVLKGILGRIVEGHQISPEGQQKVIAALHALNVPCGVYFQEVVEQITQDVEVVHG